MRVRLVLLVVLFLGGCTRDRSLTSEKVVAFTRALSAWYDQTAAAGLAGTIDVNEMTNRQVDELSMLNDRADREGAARHGRHALRRDPRARRRGTGRAQGPHSVISTCT